MKYLIEKLESVPFRLKKVKVTDETGQSKELYCFENEEGINFSKPEEILEILKNTQDFYQLPNIEQTIEDTNQEIDLEYERNYIEHMGLYEFRPYKKLYKSAWGFTCAKCKEKIKVPKEPTNGEGFYLWTMCDEATSELGVSFARFCSEECAGEVKKEYLKIRGL